jgi:hypothetical protein
MRKTPGVFAATLLAVTCAVLTPAHAGWVMTESNGNVTHVANGMMKSVWESGSVILKGTDGTIVMIDDQRRMYTASDIEEFCETAGSMFEKVMENIPPEQREMMKQMMGGESGGPPPDVVVVKEGAGGKIAGFETDKYTVSVDGDLYEEVWVATDEELLKDFGPLTRMIADFMGCSLSIAAMGGTPPEATEEYLKLMETGLMLKVERHDEDAPGTATDVTALVKADVPESTFEIPSGYRKVEYMELMGME